MLSYQALALTDSALFVGIQASAFSLAGLVAALPAGRFADRCGSAVLCVGGLGCSLIGTLIPIFYVTPPGLLVAAALIGAGHIGLLVGQQSFVVKQASARNQQHDSAFAALTAAASFGQLIGPPTVATGAALASESASPNTTVGLMICAGFLGLAVIPVGVLFRSEQRLSETVAAVHIQQRVPVSEILGIPGMWRALTTSGAVLITVDLLAAFLPLWAIERDVSAAVVGLLLALRAVVTILSRFGMTRLLARLGRRKLLVVAMSVAAMAHIAIPFTDQWTAIFVMILIGFGLGLPQPLTMGWVVSLAPPGGQGAALGLRMTSNRFAQVSIPLCVGALAGPTGSGAVFWTSALFLISAVGITARSGSDTTETSSSHGLD